MALPQVHSALLSLVFVFFDIDAIIIIPLVRLFICAANLRPLDFFTPEEGNNDYVVFRIDRWDPRSSGGADAGSASLCPPEAQ